MKKIIKTSLPLIDMVLVPFVYLAAKILKNVRRAGVHRLPICKEILFHVGVFPIRNHYYEPQFDNRTPKIDFSNDRVLAGVDLNVKGQFDFLKLFVYSHELQSKKSGMIEFFVNNGSFLSGDAEYWYQIIRAIKPRRVIEIGSGNSTLIAIKAIRANQADDSEYTCEHICIEPYEMPWLEDTGVSVVRSKVEDVDLSFFSKLEKNDILFIDSTHIIRPQGDVLFEYLELLPSLNIGVIVHIHDIFTPKNYLKQWLQDDVRFWNEQYLLEAFLTHNEAWRVLGALNYLHHNHFDKLKSIAPFLAPDREPGSFYMQKKA